MTGYILQENKLTAIEKSIPDDPRVHCLICQGEGNQFYAVCDLSDTGLIWTQDIYEVEGGYKDASGILVTHGDAKYAALQNDYQWKVETYEKLQLAAGDFVTLKPTKGESEYLSIAEYEINSKNLVTLKLGSTDPKFLDSWEVLQGFDKGYTDRYIQTSHEAITQPTTFTPPATGTLTFTVPTDALEAALLPRVTLKLTLNLQSDTGLLVNRVAVRLMVGTAYPAFGQFPPTTIGGIELPEIDVTESVVAGANAFTIDVIPESGTISQISASGTMNFYKRSEIK